MLGITWVDSLSIGLLFATKLRGRQWICDSYMTSFCKVSVTSVLSKIAPFGFVTNFIKGVG